MNDTSLKRRSLPMVIALFLITGGLYGIYLLLNLGFAVAKENGGRRSWALNGFIVAFVALILLFAILAPITAAVGGGQAFRRMFSPAPAMLLAFVLAITTYILAAKVASSVGAFVRARQASLGIDAHCSSVVAAWLTILGFLGALYLQHHVNKIFPSEPRR